MRSDNPHRVSSEADFVPKVFVSYSWAGKVRAKRIADFLRTECGVDVVIDIYHLKPGHVTRRRSSRRFPRSSCRA